MTTAFVTGATGFVGLNLVERLCDAGWRVTALHRPSSKLTYLERFPAERVVGDITEPSSLEAAMPEGVDVVFHVAASLNLWSRGNPLQTRVNVDGTRNVVAAALARKAGRFVHTSSISAWGNLSGRIDETMPQRGRDSWINYQRTKFLAEEEVREGIERGLDAVIVNPPNIVGPYDTTGWARLIRLVHENALPGVPPGENSFCHVREVVKALVAAAERGRTGENYLLGGVDASYLEAVRIIGELTGRDVPGKAMPPIVLKAMGRLYLLGSYVTGKEPRVTPEAISLVCRRLFTDCGKARRELGLEPVPLAEMIGDSHRWLAEEGYLPSRP